MDAFAFWMLQLYSLGFGFFHGPQHQGFERVPTSKSHAIPRHPTPKTCKTRNHQGHSVSRSLRSKGGFLVDHITMSTIFMWVLFNNHHLIINFGFSSHFVCKISENHAFWPVKDTSLGNFGSVI